MTRVYSHPDPAIAHLVLNRLQQLGVDAVVRGEALGRGMGEVPPIAAWAEVWVADGARLADVEAVVAEVTAEPASEPEPWFCALCGETIDAVYIACWSCGSPAPDAA